jgi:hypothetical protein
MNLRRRRIAPHPLKIYRAGRSAKPRHVTTFQKPASAEFERRSDAWPLIGPSGQGGAVAMPAIGPQPWAPLLSFDNNRTTNVID